VLVLRDIDAIEAAREVRVLVTAQYVDLTDEALDDLGGHPPRIRRQIARLHEPDQSIWRSANLPLWLVVPIPARRQASLPTGVGLRILTR
jgi:hypothetical protein